MAYRSVAGVHAPDGEAEVILTAIAGDHSYSLDIRPVIEGELILPVGRARLKDAVLMPYALTILINELPILGLGVAGVCELEEQEEFPAARDGGFQVVGISVHTTPGEGFELSVDTVDIALGHTVGLTAAGTGLGVVVGSLDPVVAQRESPGLGAAGAALGFLAGGGGPAVGRDALGLTAEPAGFAIFTSCL